jgi:hypothetical protein
MQQLFWNLHVPIHTADTDFTGLNRFRMAVRKGYHKTSGVVHIQSRTVANLITTH